MKPKNLAIGVGILALIAIVLKFTSGPADDSGNKNDRQDAKGRLLLTKDKDKLLDKTHSIEIVAKNTLFLNDDDKYRSDLGNYVLSKDAKKDDEVIAKAGTRLDRDIVAKLREKEVSSVETTETLVLELGVAGWLVKSLFNLPAGDKDPFDPEDGFVKDIRSAKIVRTAGESEKVAEKHETDKTIVTFKDKDGNTLWKFSPGKRHDNGGRFASVDGETYAYHVVSERDSDNDSFRWLNIDNENSDWVEKNLLEHLEEDDEIEKVELIYPTLPPIVEKITFTRDGKKWTTDHKVAGKDFDESKAKSLIDKITDVRWNDLVAVDSENVNKAKGHFRKLLVHTKSFGTYQVQVGRSPAPPKEEKKEEEDKDKKDDQEPKPGPVVTFIDSFEVSSQLHKLSDKTVFDAGESLYTAIPDTLAGFFKDPPPPPPPPPAATSGTGGVSVSGGAKVTTPPSTTKKPKISVATQPIAVPPPPPPPPSNPPSTPPPTITPPAPPATNPPAEPEAK
jgi:hypothetical protein